MTEGKNGEQNRNAYLQRYCLRLVDVLENASEIPQKAQEILDYTDDANEILWLPAFTVNYYCLSIAQLALKCEFKYFHCIPRRTQKFTFGSGRCFHCKHRYRQE